MAKRKPTKDEIYAAVLAQIHIGIAMARASGIVCGSPQNIRIYEVKTDG
jgi:hypothetical protein